MKKIVIDEVTNSLVVTAKFYREAHKFGTPEHKLLKKVRKDYPESKWTLKRRTINRNPEKKTYRNLTYANMALYIVVREGENSPRLDELKANRKLSKSHSSPYMFVRDWFLGIYPDFEDFTAVVEEHKANGEIDKAQKTSTEGNVKPLSKAS